MKYVLIACICILAVSQAITFITFRKKFKEQKTVNTQLEKNQETLQKNILTISSLVSKAQTGIEKQYDNIKRIEIVLLQKVNPLLDKNAIVDDLRRKLSESEKTVNGLRSTILQMSQTFKRMQKTEKEEHAQETVKRKTSKKPVKQ